MSIPNPGSGAAQEQGCTCPVLDNHYGRGRDGKDEDWPAGNWWITETCKLHWKKAPKPSSPKPGRKHEEAKAAAKTEAKAAADRPGDNSDHAGRLITRLRDTIDAEAFDVHGGAGVRRVVDVKEIEAIIEEMRCTD